MLTPCLWCHHLPDDHVRAGKERYCTRCDCRYYAHARPGLLPIGSSGDCGVQNAKPLYCGIGVVALPLPAHPTCRRRVCCGGPRWFRVGKRSTCRGPPFRSRALADHPPLRRIAGVLFVLALRHDPLFGSGFVFTGIVW